MIKSMFRYLFLLSLSAVLAPATVLFGGLPMRVVWRSFGRRAYWTGYLVIAASMALAGGYDVAVIILASAVLIGVYAEVEDHGSNPFNAGFVAILATLGTAGLAVGIWLFQTHSSLMKELRAAVDPIAAQVMQVTVQINPSAHVTTESILQGLPSGILIVLMMTLAVAAICEPAVVSMFKLRRANYLIRARLTQFQAPDVVIWLLMLAILGAFLQHGQRQLTFWSTNAVYVFGTLYFFQGLAVVVQSFRVFRVAPFWQVLWYAMIVLQLFPFVSLIGLIDFWVDFRVRLARKPAESNKSFE